MNPAIILASSSPFRQSILEKLQLPFSSFAPAIDETPQAQETPEQLVRRLSEEKAKTAQQHFSHGLAIGSDQVAVFQQQILGKPHNKENAVRQLSRFSGQRVEFLTGLCVYDIASGKFRSHVVPFSVHFRTLTAQQIDYYCEVEQPYQCAGSFKCEGLGIALFEKLQGDDPNTLIGLPLIQLTEMLLDFGVDVLSQQ